MDKTYAETKGEAPFDWNKALSNPPEIGSDEHIKMIGLAGSWVTCAVGNQCAIIPREVAPIDVELTNLGSKFAGDITNGDWINSRKTLSKIEERSKYLIKIELTKLNENRLNQVTEVDGTISEEGSGKQTQKG